MDRLNVLALLVIDQWPGVRLRVTEAWDDPIREVSYPDKSLHHEGKISRVVKHISFKPWLLRKIHEVEEVLHRLLLLVCQNQVLNFNCTLNCIPQRVNCLKSRTIWNRILHLNSIVKTW